MPKDRIGERAKNCIDKSTEGLICNSKNKYSRFNKKAHKYFINGFDLLQYTIVVRPFIMQLHLIKDSKHLDALLYLFPIQFFTISDFRELPLTQHNISLTKLVEEGYIELAIQKSNINGKLPAVYTLTPHSIRIVKDYYMYLSGEKVVNTKTNYQNPFKEVRSKVNKIREKVMMKLKHQSENWNKDFKERYY